MADLKKAQEKLQKAREKERDARKELEEARREYLSEQTQAAFTGRSPTGERTVLVKRPETELLEPMTLGYWHDNEKRLSDEGWEMVSDGTSERGDGDEGEGNE